MKNDFHEQLAAALNLSLEGIHPPSETEKHTLHLAAHQLYQEGNYETSAKLFTQLILTAPFNAEFWRGLASSEQMKHTYSAALHAWCMVVLLNPKDPTPHFHAAECYLSEGNRKEAKKALDAAEKLLNLESDEGKRLEQKINTLKGQHP